MSASAAAAAAATAVAAPAIGQKLCLATRQDLDAYLAQSQHGKNQAVFDCYFMPNVMPPRCASCQRLIVEHPAAAAASAVEGGTGAVPTEKGGTPLVTTTAPGAPTPMSTSHVVVGGVVVGAATSAATTATTTTPVGSAIHGPPVAEAQPIPISSDGTHDVHRVGRDAKASIVPGLFIIFVGLALLKFFNSIGFVCSECGILNINAMMPVGCLIAGVGMIFGGEKPQHLIFDKRRKLICVRRFLRWWNETEIPFSAVRSLSYDPSSQCIVMTYSVSSSVVDNVRLSSVTTSRMGGRHHQALPSSAAGDEELFDADHAAAERTGRETTAVLILQKYLHSNETATIATRGWQLYLGGMGVFGGSGSATNNGNGETASPA